MNRDAEHLRLLAIFHYIVAGVGVVASFFPFLYTGMGALFVYLARQPIKPGESPPPEVLGWFMIGFGIWVRLLDSLSPASSSWPDAPWPGAAATGSPSISRASSASSFRSEQSSASSR